MSDEQVAITAQQVSNGVTRWDAATAALTAAWEAARAAVDQLSKPDTWGGDGPGSSFESSYGQGGGPKAVMFTAGEPVIAQVRDLGPAVRTAVGTSLAADDEQAAAVRLPPIQGVDG